MKRDGDELLLKLEKGEDVLSTLTEAIDSNDVVSGEILWGLGRIKDLQVGYFNGVEYDKKTFDQTYEIVSFHGSITENEPRFHIHVAGAGKDYTLVGGHLFGGIVDPLLEVSIKKFNNIKTERKDNPKTGLRELFF